MKKSYHSIVVPTVAATTALRSCILCSASESAPAAVVTDMVVTSLWRGQLHSMGIGSPRLYRELGSGAKILLLVAMGEPPKSSIPCRAALSAWASGTYDRVFTRRSCRDQRQLRPTYPHPIPRRATK